MIQIFAVSLLVITPRAFAAAPIIEGVEVDGGLNQENLNVLVEWGYYDEALAYRKKHPKENFELTPAKIRSAKKEFLAQVAKYDLPQNAFPIFQEYAIALSNPSIKDRLLVYCVKERKAAFSRRATWWTPERIKLLDADGKTISDLLAARECQPKDVISTITAGEKTLLVLLEPGDMAEGKKYFYLLNGKLAPVLRVEKDGKEAPLEATHSYHGPGFVGEISTDGKKFVETAGEGWNDEKKAMAIRVSTYEWRGSSYVFRNEKIEYRKN